jgi:hypothetical protein
MRTKEVLGTTVGGLCCDCEGQEQRHMSSLSWSPSFSSSHSYACASVLCAARGCPVPVVVLCGCQCRKCSASACAECRTILQRSPLHPSGARIGVKYSQSSGQNLQVAPHPCTRHRALHIPSTVTQAPAATEPDHGSRVASQEADALHEAQRYAAPAIALCVRGPDEGEGSEFRPRDLRRRSV